MEKRVENILKIASIRSSDFWLIGVPERKPSKQMEKKTIT
jgi:hypothetical protein